MSGAARDGRIYPASLLTTRHPDACTHGQIRGRNAPASFLHGASTRISTLSPSKCRQQFRHTNTTTTFYFTCRSTVYHSVRNVSTVWGSYLCHRRSLLFRPVWCDPRRCLYTLVALVRVAPKSAISLGCGECCELWRVVPRYFATIGGDLCGPSLWHSCRSPSVRWRCFSPLQPRSTAAVAHTI